jgi:hypothetical protein
MFMISYGTAAVGSRIYRVVRSEEEARQAEAMQKETGAIYGPSEVVPRTPELDELMRHITRGGWSA